MQPAPACTARDLAMNELLDDDDRAPARNDRELTLSTGAILGIFFGLVLLCGICFGVGYNTGRKSLPTPLALNDGSNETLSENNGAPKPAAGSPAVGSSIDSSAAASAPSVVAAPIAAPAPKPAPIVRKPPPVDADTTAAPTADAAEVPPARTVSPSALLPGATATPAGSSSIMVQVAAVSHQEDADLLVGALRARGYPVSARPNTSDTFIHVQVGPFSNKKDAEAMRQRLLADGYNALLKY